MKLWDESWKFHLSCFIFYEKKCSFAVSSTLKKSQLKAITTTAGSTTFFRFASKQLFWHLCKNCCFHFLLKSSHLRLDEGIKKFGMIFKTAYIRLFKWKDRQANKISFELIHESLQWQSACQHPFISFSNFHKSSLFRLTRDLFVHFLMSILSALRAQLIFLNDRNTSSAQFPVNKFTMSTFFCHH